METATTAPQAATKAATTTTIIPLVDVVLEDLSYSVPITRTGNKEQERFTILHNLQASFVAGQLTALMGPSGSGKSTLLDILAGRKNVANLSARSRVWFNGQVPDVEAYRQTVGYVEQFDTLVGELTVESMLQYTAALKLPRYTTPAARAARVQEVLQMLNLESCRSNRIGKPLRRGISGGQAKRVNIGLALITRPPVVLLDEPTSGLDSRVANEVVQLLQTLAHQGPRTIVCTIHAPTGHAFALFDHLYMIHNHTRHAGNNNSMGGQTIYDGPIAAAQTYFETTSGISKDPDASLPEWLVDLTSELQSLQASKSGGTSGQDKADFVALYQASPLKQQADQVRKDTLTKWQAKTQKDETDDVPFSWSSSDQDLPPTEWSKLVTLLKYRGIANYKSVAYLGPRFGDKTLFGLLILSLYYGIGSELDTRSIANTASFLFFLVCLCGFGAAAFVPTLNLERKLFYRELDDGCYAPTTYYASKFIQEAVLALFSSGFWISFIRYSWAAFMLNCYQDTPPGQIPIFFNDNGDGQTILEFYGMVEGPVMNSVAECLACLTGLLVFFAIVGVLALVFIRHDKR
eukprot:scaffold134_cov94-Amphora_coffeaeformis.AAC.6